MKAKRPKHTADTTLTTSVKISAGHHRKISEPAGNQQSDDQNDKKSRSHRQSASRRAGPFRDFFQMLLGFSFINFFAVHTAPEDWRTPDAPRRFNVHDFAPAFWTAAALCRFSTRRSRHQNFHTLATRLRQKFGPVGVAVSRAPINSASIRCCCFSSTMTSGDGGAAFSAMTGDLSRTEKSTAKIRIQTAASPAHALG